jgi:hypothetical protein
LTPGGFSHRRREGLFSAVSVGFFLVLVGVLFVTRPNLYNDTVTFFSNFNVNSTVPNTQMLLPAPDPQLSRTNVTVHDANLSVYSAVQQFSLVWGIFSVVLLVMRFASDSSWRRRAENVSNIVFWFGTVYLIQAWLIDTTKNNTYKAQTWFQFWSLILVLLGISLIVRAVCLAVVRREHV